MLVLLHVGPEDDLVFPDDDPGVEASFFCFKVLLVGDFLLNMMRPQNYFPIKVFYTHVDVTPNDYFFNMIVKAGSLYHNSY